MKKGSLMRRDPRSRTGLMNDPFFRGFDSLLGDDLFRPLSLFRNWTREDLGQGEWLPALDIRESKDHYVVTAELPGLDKKDVNISVENNVLTLSGERRFDEETQDDTYHRVERAYGAFSRSFTLPTEVNPEQVTAIFKNGLLTITVPKVEQAKRKTIEIS